MNAKVMVLGTFHFHQEGVRYLDIQSEARQAQIRELADKISAFKPNKMAVEKLPSAQSELDARYQKYLRDGVIDVNKLHASGGVFDNSGDVNEIAMLGFPIAKTNGIQKLYAIDYLNDWIRDEAIEYTNINAPMLLEEIDAKEREFIQFEMGQIGKSVAEICAFMNSPEAIRKQHSDTFLIINQIGAFDGYAGSKFLLSWYERNLKIFANIQAICGENDRLLVIIGAAHLATLNALIQDYYKLDFASPLEYL